MQRLHSRFSPNRKYANKTTFDKMGGQQAVGQTDRHMNGLPEEQTDF